jgi:hypothetical protein
MGYVTLVGSQNQMGAPKNELGINQGKIKKQRRGGCRTRNGEALNSAFKGYYTKNGFWQD